MKPKFKPQFYWLIHHRILLEALTEPISMRCKYIQANKAPTEIATRLKWMRPVERPDLLPEVVVKTYADWQKAIKENWEAIDARHKAECPGCPFDYKKRTLIFK